MKLGYVSGMDDDVIARLALIVTREGSREKRAAPAADQEDSGSELMVPIVAGRRVAGTLDVESGGSGAFSGSSIADYERLADALRPLWDQPPRR